MASAPRRVVEVSDKDNVNNVYKIPVGALKESPLKEEVILVLVEEKTYVVPKDDFPLEKYPLYTNVRSVIKCSKGKTASERNTYIVKKEDLNEKSKNSIDEEHIY